MIATVFADPVSWFHVSHFRRFEPIDRLPCAFVDLMLRILLPHIVSFSKFFGDFISVPEIFQDFE